MKMNVKQIFKEFEKFNNTVDNYDNHELDFIEDYSVGQKYRILQKFQVNKDDINNGSILSRNSRRPTINKTYVSGNNILENVSILQNTARSERRAARLASIKVKKNLNIPLKLRQPSVGDIFEGTLGDKENNNKLTHDVTNIILNSEEVKTTKVLRKHTRSRAHNLTETTVTSPDVGNQPTLAAKNAIRKQPDPSTQENQPLVTTLGDKENNNELTVDVTNIILNTEEVRTTKVLRKHTRSRAHNLTETTITSPDVGNQPTLAAKNADRKQPDPSTQENQPLVTTSEQAVVFPNSDATKTGPSSIVRLRTKQFENLAAKNHTFVRSTIRSNSLEPDNNNGKSNQILLTVAISPKKLSSETETLNKVNKAKVSCAAVLEELHSPAGNMAISNTEPPVITARITRAMASKNQESTMSENTSSSSTASERRGVKRAAVAVKCKKMSLKNRKLSGNSRNAAKKKTSINHRKHQERLNKAKAAREARLRMQHEAEVQAQIKKAEKMKAIAAEREKQQKEEEAKKVAAAKQKKIEMEERRKREEAVRLARLEELEEERKRVEAAYKKKKEEEAEAIRVKKLAQESKTTAKPQQQKKENSKTPTPLGNKTVVLKNTNITHSIENAESYVMTPDRNNRALRSPKTPQDYGVDEAESSDSSEDEDNPKKRIPAWAERNNRLIPTSINSYVPLKIWNRLYKCDNNPQVNSLLGTNKYKRLRTSSAFWPTPPLAR